MEGLSFSWRRSGFRLQVDQLRLQPGEVTALIGPNGAGKSTCFNMLMGQIRPSAGEIFLKGERLVNHTPRKVWRKGVGRTFQITAAYASMSVVENVQMALISHHRRVFSIGPRARDLYRDRARALLGLVDMEDQADRHAAVLAYGDLKRLELAVALAHDPELLLMDEPTAGMAPKERIALMQLVSDIVRDKGVSVLFTEHDMDVVFGHADRVLVLERGRILAEGTPEEVRANPEVRRVYLGGAGAGAPEGAPA